MTVPGIGPIPASAMVAAIGNGAARHQARRTTGQIQDGRAVRIARLKPFTPHDLRRTAATLAGELGYSDAAIAKCLDHAVTKDDGEKVHRVTGIYNQSKRMQQKRNVLDGIAAELRRIIGEPVEAGLRMAA